MQQGRDLGRRERSISLWFSSEVSVTVPEATSNALAMLISHTHRFAFVHVPKTAGSSVVIALGGHADCANNFWANRWLAAIGIHVNHVAPWRYKRFRPHVAAAVLQAQLPTAVFNGLFKFAFVRNPWDLLVSSYHYLRTKPEHRRSRLVRSLPSFTDYVEYEISRGRLVQSALLCDRRGTLLMDFVGRYESLESDFDFICRRIGLEATLPRVNAGSRGDYRGYYTPSLAGRVAEAFAADIDRFGYDFDGGQSERQGQAA